MGKWPALCGLILSLAAPAYSAGEPAEAPPPFTLNSEADDQPELARLKAALRLMKSAQVTVKALQSCSDSEEAETALKSFNSRNGNTLVTILNAIRGSGGTTPEIKALMDREVAAETAVLGQEIDCRTLAARTLNGERDLYKAPALADDYRLLRGR